MSQILCSTGALIGKPNNRDYTLLKGLAGKLECDGFEFMMYESKNISCRERHNRKLQIWTSFMKIMWWTPD